ncbi:MAG TPA: hypothetical protein PLC54_01930 [Spirochaetales bacterium]|nr:hypothetical protein [Spirochaetales bacterium]
MEAQTGTRHAQPAGKDIASAIISIIGAALALGGFTVLVVRAAASVSRGHTGAGYVAAVSIYGACIVYRFVMSALYRFSPGSRVLGSLDDAGAFFLVAGTLMPVLFSYLDGLARWLPFSFALAYAVVAYILHLTILGPMRHLILLIGYTSFFLAFPAIVSVRQALGGLAAGWLLLGGVVYLIGFVWKDRRGFPYAESIWLACAVAGSACQYFGISSFLS